MKRARTIQHRFFWVVAIIAAPVLLLLTSCSNSADSTETADCGSAAWGLQTLEHLTRSAPVIITGTVTEVQAEFGEYLGRDDFIFTYVTVSVQHALKGIVDEQITIKVLGGQIGDRVMGGERNFGFKESEEVLLFLSPIGQNRYEVYSISGKLPIVRKESKTHFDTTMLRSDDVSDYGYQSTTRVEEIRNRIKHYLSRGSCPG